METESVSEPLESGTVICGRKVMEAASGLIPFSSIALWTASKWAGVGQNFITFGLGFKILGSCFQRDFHKFILAGGFPRNDDLPFSVEKTGDRAGSSDGTTIFREDAANFSGGAIAIIGR